MPSWAGARYLNHGYPYDPEFHTIYGMTVDWVSNATGMGTGLMWLVYWALLLWGGLVLVQLVRHVPRTPPAPEFLIFGLFL